MTEAELIKRCKHGDRDAFNELVMRFQSPVINTAYGMLSNYDDAADAAQEVFLRVYRSLNDFRGKSSLGTWIYTIMKNVCSDMLRRRQRESGNLSINAPPEDGGAEEIRDDALLPEEQYERNEKINAVREAIACLRDEYREILTLCDIEQLSYDEAAQILRCPPGTVKSRLNRARNALRKNLLKNRNIF